MSTANQLPNNAQVVKKLKLFCVYLGMYQSIKLA